MAAIAPASLRTTVNGVEVPTGEFNQIHQVWDKQEVTLKLEMEAQLVKRPNGLWVAGGYFTHPQFY